MILFTLFFLLLSSIYVSCFEQQNKKRQNSWLNAEQQVFFLFRHSVLTSSRLSRTVFKEQNSFLCLKHLFPSFFLQQMFLGFGVSGVLFSMHKGNIRYYIIADKCSKRGKGEKKRRRR